jgi:predicted metalloprotease with PDZ domain
MDTELVPSQGRAVSVQTIPLTTSEPAWVPSAVTVAQVLQHVHRVPGSLVRVDETGWDEWEVSVSFPVDAETGDIAASALMRAGENARMEPWGLLSR